MFEDLEVLVVEEMLDSESMSSLHYEVVCEKLDSKVKQIKDALSRKTYVTTADRVRWVEEDEKFLAERRGEDPCDGCESFLPGIRFPCLGRDASRWPSIERCDSCKIFPDDREAAAYLGALIDIPVRVRKNTFYMEISLKKGEEVWSTLKEQMGLAKKFIHLGVPSEDDGEKTLPDGKHGR